MLGKSSVERIKKNNSKSRKYNKLHTKRNSQSNIRIRMCVEAVKGLEAQLKGLEKAQKFIFMEYHVDRRR